MAIFRSGITVISVCSYAPISIPLTLVVPTISLVGVAPLPAFLAGDEHLIISPSSTVAHILSAPFRLEAFMNNGSKFLLPVPA